jgi:hypothetical protein
MSAKVREKKFVKGYILRESQAIYIYISKKKKIQIKNKSSSRQTGLAINTNLRHLNKKYLKNNIIITKFLEQHQQLTTVAYKFFLNVIFNKLYCTVAWQ